MSPNSTVTMVANGSVSLSILTTGSGSAAAGVPLDDDSVAAALQHPGGPGRACTHQSGGGKGGGRRRGRGGSRVGQPEEVPAIGEMVASQATCKRLKPPGPPPLLGEGVPKPPATRLVTVARRAALICGTLRAATLRHRKDGGGVAARARAGPSARRRALGGTGGHARRWHPIQQLTEQPGPTGAPRASRQEPLPQEDLPPAPY